MRNILLISPLPPPHGGIATWTKKILDYGLPGNYKISIINTKLSENRNIFDSTKITFQEVKRNVRILFSCLIKLIFSRQHLVHLNCSLSKVGIFRDVLLCLLVRLRGIPLVTHYRGNIIDFSSIKFKKYLHLLMKFSHANIAMNQASYEYIKNIAPHRISFLLPNFIEDHLIAKQEKNIHPTQKTYQVIFVGGISQSKGCLEILEVAKRLPHYHFHLVGKIQQDMQEALKLLPDNVILTDALDHPDILQKMAESDLLFFPSHTEGFPNVVLEAMACGLPVIATNVGSIPEMIDPAGGNLVTIKDIDAMVKSIQFLLSNPDSLKQMGRYNSQKCQKQYAYSIVSRHLTHLYEKIWTAS